MSKLYPCNSCGAKVPIRSKGLCPKCREEQRTNNGEKTMLNTIVAPLPSITDKTRKKKLKIKSIRDVYFAYHIERCKASEESGAKISEPTRANICHILPKSTHPSVQANLDNFVYLTFSEHERFDQLLFKHEFETIQAEFPNSWKIILSRLKKVIPLCYEKTRLYFKLKKIIDE